jgi:NAD(P)-dependent dehydrogenase (short-subunit alcohol dehydrogenase family)
VRFCKVDVIKTDDIVNAVEMAKSIGPVRVLVNSAGIGWAQPTVGKDGTYESAANLDAFKRVIAINLVGSFDCIRIVGTAMSTTEPMEFGERGAIVNIASVAAFDGQIGRGLPASGGIVGLTPPIAPIRAIGVRGTCRAWTIDTPILARARPATRQGQPRGCRFRTDWAQEELAPVVVECIPTATSTPRLSARRWNMPPNDHLKGVEQSLDARSYVR